MIELIHRRVNNNDEQVLQCAVTRTHSEEHSPGTGCRATFNKSSFDTLFIRWDFMSGARAPLQYCYYGYERHVLLRVIRFSAKHTSIQPRSQIDKG